MASDFKTFVASAVGLEEKFPIEQMMTAGFTYLTKSSLILTSGGGSR